MSFNFCKIKSYDAKETDEELPNEAKDLHILQCNWLHLCVNPSLFKAN